MRRSPARGWPVRTRSSPSTSTTASSSGPRSSARRTRVNSRNADPVEYIKSVTGGNGADVCIEAIGNPAVYKQAFEARDLAGTVVLVGVPRPDMVLELPFIEVFGRGGALKSSWYGDCLPSRDFPMLVTLHQQGRLPLDKFVSETISLDDVEEAFHKMERGEVLRSVVRAVTIELVTTDGIFALDGGEWEVTNNIWLVGDDREVLVFDAAHDAAPIVDAVNGRRVKAIVLTHGHNDHINAAVPLRDAVDAPVLLHDADTMLWDVVWPGDTARRRRDARRAVERRRARVGRAAHAGPLAGMLLLPRRRQRCGVQRRHAVLRRPRRHRSQLQRRADHRALDPRRAAGAARSHDRAHRPRRQHHHRRRTRRRPGQSRRARHLARAS